MTKVTLVCGKDGAFRSCRAEGHAGFSRAGSDIVCAAESVLLGTAMKVLAATPGVSVMYDESDGRLEFRIEGQGCPNLAERLRCVADFVDEGVSSLAHDHPGHVEFFRRQED